MLIEQLHRPCFRLVVAHDAHVDLCNPEIGGHVDFRHGEEPVRRIPEFTDKICPHFLLDEGCKDRKSTRLNSSHGYISYAVFCLKKKKIKQSTNDCMLSSHSHT